jgi:hypothetical protein
MRRLLYFFAVAILVFSFLSFLSSILIHHVDTTTEFSETHVSRSLQLSLDFIKREKLSMKRKQVIADPLRTSPVLPAAKRIIPNSPTSVRDDFCPDCRLLFQNPSKLCGTLVQKVLDQSNATTTTTTTTSQAGEQVAQNNAEVCSRCSPTSCSDADKNYYRLDDVAPRIQAAHTLFLESVAQTVRFPVAALSNVSAFLSNPQNVYPAREYLFEFNPSIVQLPASQIPDNMDIPGERPVYLASFRVGNDHLCIMDPEDRTKMIGGDWRKWTAQKNHLGLALLRSDLSVIRDTVVDAKEYMHRFTDPRLHVIHDQIYISSYHRIHPIWIVPPPDLPANYTENGKALFPFTVELSKVWPSEMTITMRRHGSCTKDRMLQLSGKNLQYFVDADNRTMMEANPMGQKEHIDLDARCQKTPKNAPPAPFVEASKNPWPYSSFGTTDELHFAEKRVQEYPYSGEHGSACCIHAQGPGGPNGHGRPLLLGVSHTKSREGHEERFGVGPLQYSSRFYAMEAVAPYRVVARTGRFCFGFPEPSESSPTGGSANSTTSRNRNPYTQMSMEKLKVGQEYDCPKIHFVGSMIEKANDPSKLIVAYGVNDCVPRIVEIDKADVLSMLSSPHERFQTRTTHT